MSVWSQYFPPRPSFTEANIESQHGKIFLITGGYSGVGFELAAMLYAAGAKIYIAGRTEASGRAAITKIQQEHERSGQPSSPGTLTFLYVDFADFSTIGPAAKRFLKQESRLDVLWNNAGVGATFNGETAAQGLPIQFAANCAGPQLFTQLLQPALERSAGARVIWAASTVVDASAPKGGMLLADFQQPKNDGIYNYTVTKTGNWFLASEFARREKLRLGKSQVVAETSGADSGASSPSPPILHVAVNPGNLRTAVWRTWSRLFVAVLSAIFLYDARYGAYSELWAGLTTELDAESDNGSYVVPWGRKHPQPRADILASLKSKLEGGTGIAAQFYDWCEKQTVNYR